MLNKNERMNKLNQAGINTGKYFTLDLPEGVAAGSQIHVIINENGVPVVKNNDTIFNQIIEDGYVRNTKLHRRFVMAQMFHALNYVSYNGRDKGYTEWLKRRDFTYSFKTMLEEIRVLSKLEVRDAETFIERSHFFTKEVIVETMADYVEDLKAHIETLRTYKCKGIPYKKVKGQNIFVVDLDKKVYRPLNWDISRVNSARNYSEIYKIVKNFMSNMINIPYNTPKSKAWVDAYKGEGAFYTLKNLIMFHGCGIKNDDTGKMCYGVAAMAKLNAKLNQYQGEGWRMFALMKKVIKDNKFDFHTRMEEIYNN